MLTDAAIKALKPKEKLYKIVDRDGLYVVVQPSGAIVFRLRRRGETLEAAVIEELVPDRRTGSRLVRRMLRESGADYAIGLTTGPHAGLVRMPVPGMGPILTTRPLASSPPPADDWCLTLGDVELF